MGRALTTTTPTHKSGQYEEGPTKEERTCREVVIPWVS